MIQTWLCNCQQYLYSFHIVFECPQVYMIKERCWFYQIDSSLFSTLHRINVLFLTSQFDVIHIKQIRITLFHGVRISIPNWKPSPNRVSKGFSQIAFPITVLPKDDHTDFAQEERLGPSILDHDFGHLCRGKTNPNVWTFRFGNFQ